MTRSASKISKGSIVRIANVSPEDKYFGETAEVVSTSKKGSIAKIRVLRFATTLDVDVPFLALASEISISKHHELDLAVSDRIRKEQERAAEFKRKQAEREAAALAKRLENDRVWSEAEPFVVDVDPAMEGSRLALGMTARTIRVLGPVVEDRRGNLHHEEASVEVFVERTSFGVPDGTIERKVNWASWGTVSPARARAYAKAILFAADVADGLEIPEAK